MIETDRLILRRWQARDRPALRAQVFDPEVMRFLIPIDSDAAFEEHLARLTAWHDGTGFTFWVVERRSDATMLGVCGLKHGGPGTPIEGEVEIGWRIGRDHWRQGYAREAAQATLDWLWDNSDVDQVAAITVQDNLPSWRLMERIGMTRVVGGDFDHPAVDDDSPLKRHILYRIERPAHG